MLLLLLWLLLLLSDQRGGGVGRSGEHDPQIAADRQTLQEMIREVMTQVLLPFHAKFTIIEGLIGGRY